ncbi:MAG TPA: TRAP transporter substrate-binding protein DctP [Xanthobacteraceae bacterium]|nr:TRAP transporter substrate-binding protein DctP [Xanthobacteraceae bacterium]
MVKSMNRRHLVAGAIAAPAVVAFGRLGSAAAAQTLKISHQFPGGTIDEGDFRDRLCRKFAADLQKRTNGSIDAQVYPNSSLMKTVAQFSAMRKGVLDLSLYPISYAGGEFAELNIGLMPGLVSSYRKGAAWKASPVGKRLAQFLAEKGIVVVSWIWQAGGVVARAKPIVNPEDAKGQKVRGGSREMDMVLKAAGAATLSVPSNEIYAAMQTGACDAAITSSTSLISFRLEEVSKSLTTGRGKSYWFMLEPLIMSRQTFDALPKGHQESVLAIGQELEAFGTSEAMADDRKVAEVYAAKGASVHDLDDKIVETWRAIARDTAWKDYAEKTPLAGELIKLAEQVHVS